MSKVICLVRESEKRYSENRHATHIVLENEYALIIETIQKHVDNLVAHYGEDILDTVMDIVEIKLGKKAM